MHPTQSPKQTRHHSPFAKPLSLATFLQRFLEKPTAKQPDHAFQRLLALVQLPVICDSDRCFFINRVQSCLDLYHGQERLTAVYQMREIVRKLQALDRGWNGPPGAGSRSPLRPRPRRPYYAAT